ncbi:YnbE family lipoprotein [Thalassotalea insulae]|uniref:YnbE family lipoprotein n=1 Tax=Thalassotalea insulae TaxID=2056778 RepID=A0ABQ6GYR5_9GAMM|nr:YnbE family lipoprotein [Thalassotalea insulae]GLX79756.1 YnbE family lipoprotein [Thalassotalea insulae]
MLRPLLSVTYCSLSLLLIACSPTVQLQAPDKPIEINMNITVDVRIAIEKELDQVLTEDSGLF